MLIRFSVAVLFFCPLLGSAPFLSELRAAPPAGEHPAYMELPAEYRAWFRNRDGSCQSPDTPISTTNGSVAIADLRPSRDAILYLAADGQIQSTQRYAAFCTKQVSELLVVQTSDGRNLRCTPDHRIAVGVPPPAASRYLPAHELEVGDRLITLPEPSNEVTVVAIEAQTLATPVDVWDIQILDRGWQGEGNFFANGILVHNCVQCSNGMVGMHINRPEWTFLLWDTPYGKAVHGGSWPGRVADYARQRGMKIFNVTGNSYADTRQWMIWAAQTNRFCAIGAGGSHFQTLYGYVPGDPKPWKVCNNNSTSRIDEYSEADFRALHLASGPWVVVPDEPAPAPPPRLVEWWR